MADHRSYYCSWMDHNHYHDLDRIADYCSCYCMDHHELDRSNTDPRSNTVSNVVDAVQEVPDRQKQRDRPGREWARELE